MLKAPLRDGKSAEYVGESFIQEDSRINTLAIHTASGTN